MVGSILRSIFKYFVRSRLKDPILNDKIYSGTRFSVEGPYRNLLIRSQEIKIVVDIVKIYRSTINFSVGPQFFW